MRTIALLALLAAACASNGGGTGDDDGVDPVDGSGVDAVSSGLTVAGECVETYERTVVTSGGTTLVSRWYHVKVDADDDQRVWGLGCSYLMSGASPYACPAGATCTGQALEPGAGCEVLTSSRAIGGERLLYCGFESAVDGATTGGRWTDVTVHID